MDKTKQPQLEPLWTVKEASRRTGLSTWFIYQDIARGHLLCVRLGKNRRTIRIAPTDLEQYLKRHKTGANPMIQVHVECEGLEGCK